jgi:hypothetical protein
MSRLEAAYGTLCRELEDSRRFYESNGYSYLSPPLCEAVAGFQRELASVGKADEIQRRVDTTASLTGEGTPYARAIARVMKAGLEDWVPLEVRSGRVRKFASVDGVERYLEAVRRWLGPFEGQAELTPQQASALRGLERELTFVAQQAEEVRQRGCNWLQLALEENLGIQQNTPCLSKKPVVKYDGYRPVQFQEGCRIDEDAPRQMAAAVQSIKESVTAGIQPPISPAHAGSAVGGQPGVNAGQGDEPKGGDVNWEAAFRRLRPADRKAYLAYQYAYRKIGRTPEYREAYDWLKEYGIDQEEDGLGELTDYKLPGCFETFKRYVVRACSALGEQKNSKRRGRKNGKCVVSKHEIE